MKPAALASGREAGLALVSVLFLMIAVLIAGLSAARAALDAEKSARGERDRQVAFAAAEAALADAERDIDGAAGALSERAAMFAPHGESAFVEGCGKAGAANAGLCLFLPQRPAWQRADLAGDDGVAFGSFTGAAMPAGTGMFPARLPRYLIEWLPDIHPGEDASHRSGPCYRVTAIGFGAAAHVQVVLQSYYRKAALAPLDTAGESGQGSGANGGENSGGAAGGGPRADLPAMRLGWREVANWQALHEAVQS
jgi:type IV pilus assembly protein PilX